MNKQSKQKGNARSWKLFLSLLTLFVLLMLVTSVGYAQEKTFQYGADATIVANNRYGAYGGWHTCYVSGSGIRAGERSTLLMWNVGSLPRYSEVEQAVIYLRGTNGSNDRFSVFGLRKKWLENEVSWEQASSTTSWSRLGASGSWDRYSYEVGYVQPYGMSRTIKIYLNTDLVQDWLDYPQGNFGVILVADGAYDDISFRCSETSYSYLRPKLSIDYSR